MWFKDGSGFPLTLKPSHLFGSTEFMDASEVLAAIVERACLFTPEKPVGASNPKGSGGGVFQTRKKEARFDVDKVPMVEPVRGSAYPDLVSFKQNY